MKLRGTTVPLDNQLAQPTRFGTLDTVEKINVPC